MQEFLSTQIFNNTIKQLLIALAFVLGGFIVAKLTFLILKKIMKSVITKSKTQLDDIIFNTLNRPLVISLVVFGFYLGVDQLNTSEQFKSLNNKFHHVVIILMVTWFVVRLIKALIDSYIKALVLKSESAYDDQLMPVVKQLIFLAVWSMGIIIALKYSGYDVNALIAGLGIGGLAFALAAKDYIENIFGGVSVFTDKPFMVKDRIKIDGFDGTVEEIGIRRSRIRTLGGTLVTIPNAKFIHNSVENVALELTRKVITQLGLTYDTSSGRIELAMEILKDIVNENQELVTDEPIIFFSGFGPSSLDITFIYYIRKAADIAQTQSTINLEVLKRFEAVELEFAFPTQTLHIEKGED